jgi:hypothetical protein
MNDTSSPKSPRSTLKLKVGARKPTDVSRTTPIPQPDRRPKLKPDAHWSDEYKARMQADMDALRGR